MQLSDVVRVLGNQTIGSFPWGHIVCSTVNLFADPSLRLSSSSTGADLERCLAAMSENNRALLYNAQLDINNAGPVLVQDVGGGLTVQHGDDMSALGPLLTPKNIATGSVVSLTLMCCFVLISGLAVNEKTDWSALTDEAIEIFKSIVGL